MTKIAGTSQPIMVPEEVHCQFWKLEMLFWISIRSDIETSLKWLTVAMHFLENRERKTRERLERDLRET